MILSKLNIKKIKKKICKTNNTNFIYPKFMRLKIFLLIDSIMLMQSIIYESFKQNRFI